MGALMAVTREEVHNAIRAIREAEAENPDQTVWMPAKGDGLLYGLEHMPIGTLFMIPPDEYWIKTEQDWVRADA